MRVTFYEYDQHRVYTGRTWVPGPKDIVPKNWTHVKPPPVEGYHIFDGYKWFTRDTYPEVHQPRSSTNRHITRLAFLNRFTDEESIRIDLASIGATVEAAKIRRYLSKISAANYIDLDSEDLIKGITSLEDTGLLDEGRSAEILNAPVNSHELPI